jgi:hypothetical protein
MSDPINLAKPHRTIRTGVILANSLVFDLSFYKLTTNLKRRETELLDVAPIDIFNALSKKFVHDFPEGILPDHLRAQALDVEFHWVNETGKPAALTCGLHINTTVIVLMLFIDLVI